MNKGIQCLQDMLKDFLPSKTQYENSVPYMEEYHCSDPDTINQQFSRMAQLEKYLNMDKLEEENVSQKKQPRHRRDRSTSSSRSSSASGDKSTGGAPPL